MRRRRHIEQLLLVGFWFSFVRFLFEGPIVVDEEPPHLSGFCEFIVILGIHFPVILYQW